MENLDKIKEIVADGVIEYLNDKKYVNLVESSLSRIWQHIENNGSFGVISPFRKELSFEQNINRYIELKNILRNDLKLGYIEMEGGFKEEGVWVVEKSLFVPNIKKNDIVELGRKYGQYSVIYKDDNEFVEIGTNEISGVGKVLNNFVKQGWDKNLNLDSELTKQFYSKLLSGSHKDKKFLFNLNECYLYEMVSMSFNEMAYSKDRLQRYIKLL